MDPFDKTEKGICWERMEYERVCLLFSYSGSDAGMEYIMEWSDRLSEIEINGGRRQ